MLLTLAVDSAFSLVEGVSASIKDKWGLSHKKVNLIVGGAAFLLGLPMLTGAGLHILDIVDHFMNSVALVLVVLGQLIIIGWSYPADKMRSHINSTLPFGSAGGGIQPCGGSSHGLGVDAGRRASCPQRRSLRKLE
jgi:NSS family neurotransmitter:Na+ symporter